MKTPEFIMIHHTAISTHKNPDQFKATNNYHRLKWNIKSSLGYYVGYHYEISAGGEVRQSRRDGEPSVACWQKNMNDGRCVHICLDGNFDTDQLPPVQVYALRDVLNNLVDKYKINKNHIFFHNDFAKKTCPGKNIQKSFIVSLLHNSKTAVKASK
jgi:hypothetical protein